MKIQLPSFQPVPPEVVGGRDGALRRPRRRAQRQAAERTAPTVGFHPASPTPSGGTAFPPGPARQRGSAMILIVILLAIMVLLVTATTRTVYWLRAEVRLVDQRQTARLTASATNQLSVVTATNQSGAN